jgi:hypothetical protein
MNEITEYGAKLEQLGKKMQDPEATVAELALGAYEIGLILQFRVYPDHTQSIEVESE